MVDILLATHNSEKYLKEQIDSLLQQAYTDIRIIIRDDGSSDNTINIINDYIKANPDRIKLVVDGKSAGSAAKNFMLLAKQADADYVMFCDHDDVWMPNKVEVSIEEIKKLEQEHGKDTPILVYTDYVVADENLQVMDVKAEGNRDFTFNGELEKLIVQNYVTGCLMAINKALCSKIGDYNEAMLMHDWWIALLAGATGIVKHVPVVTMKYRQHGSNEVGAVDVKSFKYRLNKLFAKQTKNNMNICYNQIRAFADEYKDQIPKDKYKVIDNYLSIPDKKLKINRMIALYRGNYLKSDLIRALGQLWYI